MFSNYAEVSCHETQAGRKLNIKVIIKLKSSSKRKKKKIPWPEQQQLAK